MFATIVEQDDYIGGHRGIYVGEDAGHHLMCPDYVRDRSNEGILADIVLYADGWEALK